MKRILFSLAVLAASMVSSQVLIDDTGNTEAAIEESAALQINSNDKGLLLPRLAEEPQNAVGGLVYFDTNGKCLKAYDGTAWQVLGTECAQLYTVSISVPERVYEGEDQVFNVSISPAVEPGTSISIEYITSEIPGIPLDYIDSATEDEDYVGASGTLTFYEGETNKTISVTTKVDDIVENSEHYAVLISLGDIVGNANVNISYDIAEGIILDNDPGGSTPIGNLVQNGGFESGGSINWFNNDNGVVVSDESQEGNHSIKFSGLGTKKLNQTITITPGATYTITFWYKVASGNNMSARIWSYWRNDSSNIFSNSDELRGPSGGYLQNNNNQWTEYTVTLTAPANANKFYYEVRAYGGAVVYFDNFSVVQQ
ncbi:carbohydrate binding domain-containing protein [Weeksellaceae bacterium KMM 9724]|uniref:carbohydrate binding domain-containing protein n=1 Tax=Profundicola chukchiensis TaxID=2961959 RepID=UPI00244010BB|nr:carbohydrate binding domain-containing protein [Profundicola chukchiensis]MDG4951139.1 carbohydrate binding domain-containing protein [Profundicola chukchiensis]